jgi:hypothetical protein
MRATWKLPLRQGVLMRRPIFSLVRKAACGIAVVCGMAALTDPADAQLATNAVLYELHKGSSFQQGCFPPCLCPVMVSAPVNGTFLLIPVGFDGLFYTYAVTNVAWSVPFAGSNMVVTGSGSYKIGGEVALQQELSLDLQMGGGTGERFDSGLVGELAPFPEINVIISTNHQVCFDTVFNLDASPAPTLQARLAFTSTNTVVLSWPVFATPVVLQESANLSATNWTAVTNAPIVIGQRNQVVLTRSPGNRFYRLQPGGN